MRLPLHRPDQEPQPAVVFDGFLWKPSESPPPLLTAPGCLIYPKRTCHHEPARIPYKYLTSSPPKIEHMCYNIRVGISMIPPHFFFSSHPATLCQIPSPS